MTVLDQSLLWLIPYVLLLLFMVHAMMEFTASLLIERPRRNQAPVSAKDLLNRLLALNDAHPPIPLTDGIDCDLQMVWETEDSHPPRRYTVWRSGGSGSLRFLLDETRHELRMNQVTRSYNFFIGILGWIPRLEVYYGFQAGPPGDAMTKDVRQVTLRSGWSVRPVLWWFQATRRGYRFLERLTPSPLRRMPARRFWGILYPLSYLLAMVYLAAILGPLDRSQVLMLLGISACWWGVWGFLSWMLLGFPPFWRRK